MKEIPLILYRGILFCLKWKDLEWKDIFFVLLKFYLQEETNLFFYIVF